MKRSTWKFTRNTVDGTTMAGIINERMDRPSRGIGGPSEHLLGRRCGRVAVTAAANESPKLEFVSHGALRQWAVLAGLVLAAVAPRPLAAQDYAANPSSGGQRFVIPSVPEAFWALSQRPDAVVFAQEDSPKPTECKHIEGIARKDGPDGTPYLFLTKSGVVPNSWCDIFVDEEPGYLIVARMGSRPKTGERMGTNFLPYDSSLASLSTLAEDKAVAWLTFDGTDLPAYRHPGGMQIIGDVLAIGVEHPFNGESPRAIIVFIDISNPEHPRLASRFNPPDEDGDANSEFGADPVGLTAVRTEDGTGIRYLLIVAGGPSNKEVRFYLSRIPKGRRSTDLKSPDLQWDLAGRYSEADLDACPNTQWPVGSDYTETGQHQMLNFVRQGSLDGPLYLIGGRRTGAIVNPSSVEHIDLYEMHLFSSGVPKTCPWTHVTTKTPAMESWGGSTLTGSFSAGSSVYISPSGELVVYKSNHEGSYGNTFILGEYRIGSLVRPGSPTLSPTARIDGPFVVDEGSSVTLTGQAGPPITKAFLELFSNLNVGADDTGGAWMPVEYDVRSLDRFENLDHLGSPAILINEASSSWRWFAPPGCTISANDYPLQSDEFPGPDTVQLRGTGLFEQVLDLRSLPVYRPAGTPYPVSPVPSGITGTTMRYDNDVGGVSFYAAYRDESGALVRDLDCDRYYDVAYLLGWDLDGDGSFETSGASVSFSAARLDGPSMATVQVIATHPTDTSPVGIGAPVLVPIQVRNVPPQIGGASVKDTLGYNVGAGTRPLILGLPARLAVTFTDPGLADTQTARIDWGDGTPLDTSFTSFSDAHNGATGDLSDSHIYTAPGTFGITVTITDDDDGSAQQQFTVRVLSLQDSLKSVASSLTTLINQTTNPDIASALRAARDELIGNHGGTPPTNGATDKLDANDPVAAITKIKAAISDLITAESLGAGDLSALKDPLGLVAEGIATTAYSKAQAAIPSPSPGQAKSLATIAGLIAQGHQQLGAHLYLDACDSFKVATDKAIRLLP